MNDTVFAELIPLAEAELKRYFDRELEVIEGLIRDAARVGELVCESTRLAARFIQAGMRTLTDDNPSKTPIELREKEMEEFLRLLFEGLRPRPALVGHSSS
jgi:hypothetical protein